MPQELLDYGWVALWQPQWLLAVLVFGAIYQWQVKQLEGTEEAMSKGKQAIFWMALLALYVAKGSPLSMMGHSYMFSAHMAQMSLMYLIFPPLLMSGMPKKWIRGILNWTPIRFVAPYLLHPITGLVVFNMAFTFYHFPVVFDYAWANAWVHQVYSTVLLISAFLFWWPISAPLKEYDILADLRKIAYIFIGGVLLTPVCAFIIFVGHPMYEAFQDLPQLFRVISTLEDQQLGGVIMKLTQEVAYAFMIGVIFFRWYSHERATGGRKIDSMDEIEINPEWNRA